MHHDGWRTSTEKYSEDAARASEFTSSLLFRPPFGRMRIAQYKKLKKIYKIVFWDIMPYDFDRSFGSNKSLFILKKLIRPGSIIVFHDTSSSMANMILDEFISYALGSGYSFETIPDYFS